MSSRISNVVVHGMVGGVIAGAAVATWFFVVDLTAGQPFATPALLAGAFLGRGGLEPTVGVVVAYTVLHFGVFLALGIAAMAGLTTMGISPALRHGVVFGIGVLTSVHYAALLLVDAQMLSALPAIHVLLANLLGGMLMATYFHYATHDASPFGVGVIKAHPLLGRGIQTGLAGALAVAVWFLLLDVLVGRPFFTPAALGSALFLGASSPGDVDLSFGIVSAYTVLHVAAFFAVGTAFVYVSEQVERKPGLWLIVLMAFIVVEAGFVGTVGMLGAWMLGAVGVWAIVVANFLAVATMGTWIWRTHPRLRTKLMEQPVSTMV